MFIHVDRASESAYLRRELVEYALRRSDVHVIPSSFDTIWAGSGLNEMYLASIK
jgi:hypothetical protein